MRLFSLWYYLAAWAFTLLACHLHLTQATGNNGVFCTSDAECRSQYCSIRDHACAARVGEDQSCDAQKHCKNGYNCHSVSNTCRTCWSSCRESTDCFTSDGSSYSYCEGCEMCTSTTLRSNGAYCDADSKCRSQYCQTSSGTCQPHLGEGQPCEEQKQCKIGYNCHSRSKTCRSCWSSCMEATDCFTSDGGAYAYCEGCEMCLSTGLSSNGQDCRSHSDCASSYCQSFPSRTCQPRLGEGEQCQDQRQCKSGYNCFSQSRTCRTCWSSCRQVTDCYTSDGTSYTYCEGCEMCGSTAATALGANGATCNADSQCRSQYCQTSTKKCQPRLGDGRSCEEQRHCKNGYNCHSVSETCRTCWSSCRVKTDCYSSDGSLYRYCEGCEMCTGTSTTGSTGGPSNGNGDVSLPTEASTSTSSSRSDNDGYPESIQQAYQALQAHQALSTTSRRPRWVSISGSSPDPENSDKNGGPGAGVIAAIIVGGTLGLCCLFYCCWLHTAKGEAASAKVEPIVDVSSDSSSSSDTDTSTVSGSSNVVTAEIVNNVVQIEATESNEDNDVTVKAEEANEDTSVEVQARDSSGSDGHAMKEGNAAIVKVAVSKEEKDSTGADERAMKETLVSGLRMAFTKEKVESCVAQYVKSRGPGQLDATTLAAAVMASISQRSEVARCLADAFGRFSCALVAEAAEAQPSKYDAEDIAEAVCGYVSDPDQFESVVLESSKLKNMMSYKKNKIMETVNATIDPLGF